MAFFLARHIYKNISVHNFLDLGFASSRCRLTTPVTILMVARRWSGVLDEDLTQFENIPNHDTCYVDMSCFNDQQDDLQDTASMRKEGYKSIRDALSSRWQTN